MGERVLAVRLSSLGDVILTTPAFEALKTARPDRRISVLVKRAFAPVFDRNPFVDEVLLFEDRGLLGWAAEIRRRRFDLFLDLHDTFRSRFWALASGAGRRLRYDKRTWERRRLVATKRTSPRLAGGVVDRYLECLAPLGLPAAAPHPKIYPAGEVSAALRARIGEAPFLGAAPGAAHATKRWPPERFAAALDALARPGETVLLLGAAGDRSAAEAVAARLKAPSVVLAGESGLRDLFALLALCRVVLTNDSGAMHAAAALGVPTVAVFGPTVEAFGFFPRGPKTAVVEAAGLACRPCRLHGGAACPEGHFRCMLDVTPERAAEAARKLLL